MLESSVKAINKAILAFIEAESWLECKRVLESQSNLLLSDVADQILAAWIKQSEEDAQATRVFEEYRTLLARCRREGIEAAFADRVRPPREVYEAVLALVQADSWVKCKKLVEAQRDLLLSDGADRVLASWLKQSTEDAHATRIFNEYRTLLARCRREGITAAFAGRVRPPQEVFDAVQAFVEAGSEAECKTVLSAQGERLLSQEADEVFAIWLKQAQEDPHTTAILNKYRTWLAGCRNEGIEAAFTSPPQTSRQAVEKELEKSLSQAVQALVQAENWAESKQVVEAHRDLLLSDMADQMFVILLKQAQSNPNAIRVLEQHRNLLARCRREGIEAAFGSAAQADQGDQALSAIVWAFINATSWADSKRIVQQNRDLLLSEAADQFLLDLLERYKGNHKATRVFKEHRQLLTRSRREGIEAAFTQPLQPLQTLSEALLAFVEAKDAAERKRIVQTQRDLLLSESADNLFAILLEQAKEDSQRVRTLQRYRKLLTCCRDDGIEFAFNQPMSMFDISPELRARLMMVKSKEEFDQLIETHPELHSVLEEMQQAGTDRPSSVSALSPISQPNQQGLLPNQQELLPNEELAKKLFTFVAAPSWPESQAYLQQHPELLSHEADQMLAELLTQHPEDDEERRILQEHRQLLTHARHEGIDAAFANLAPEPLHVIASVGKYLKAKSWAERKQIVEAERDLLLSDAADQVLADLQGEYQQGTPAHGILTKRRTLLAQARRQGITAAFAAYSPAQPTPAQPKAAKAAPSAAKVDEVDDVAESKHEVKPDDDLPPTYDNQSNHEAHKADNEAHKADNEAHKADKAYHEADHQPHHQPHHQRHHEADNEREPALPSTSWSGTPDEGYDFDKNGSPQNINDAGPHSRASQQELSQAVMVLLRADTLTDSRRIIEQHQDLLLNDEAERILEKLILQSQEDPHATLRLQQQRALLTRIRRDGFDAVGTTTRIGGEPAAHPIAKPTYDEETVLEKVLTFVEAKSWAESKGVVEAERDILLTDQAERILEDLLTQYQNHPEIAHMLAEHLDLLQRIRRDGIESAFAKQLGTVTAEAGSPTSSDIPSEFVLELEQATAARERLKSDNSQQALDAAVNAWQTLFDQPGIRRYTNFAIDVQSELGGVLLRRYWTLQHPSDLEAAVQAYQQVLELTPRNAPALPGRLNNLGLALRARFALHRRIQDVNAAIVAYREALIAMRAGQVILPNPSQRPSILNNLGVALSDRFALYQKQNAHKQANEDLNAAIAAYQKALKSIPTSANNRQAIQENLKLALQDREAVNRKQ